ncbi:MAG: hypothetical protein R3Y57_04555 [Erysipelotrichaceae bacterium]
MDINEICEDVQCKITEALKKESCVMVGIDGRCGSGKTTLAQALAKIYNIKVISLDDFFIPRNSTENHPEDINVEHNRFISEVLVPLFSKQDVIYQVFDCQTQCYSGKIVLPQQEVYIVEGSYAHHPLMGECYDLKIVMDIPANIQKQRIKKRNGIEAWEIFKEKWIPMEELYLKKYGIIQRADVCYQLD